jgi:fucose permease
MKNYKRCTIPSVTISLKLSWRTLTTCCFDVVATTKFEWQNLIYTKSTKKYSYAMKMCVLISFKFLWRRLTKQQNRMKERLANNCYNKTNLKKRNDQERT